MNEEKIDEEAYRVELETAAIQYANEGHAVLPLQGDDLLEGVYVDDATVKTGTIRRWLSDRRVDGVGLATGRKFFVLEFDERDSITPLDDLLPKCRQVDTPSDGLHCYIAMPYDQGFIGSCNNLIEGVNLLGSGAYVAVPPTSGHIDDGDDFGVPSLELLQAIRNLLNDQHRRIAPKLADLAIPQTKYLIDDFIPAEQVGLFVGESGCGKTTVLMSAAIAVSQGAPWMGMATQKTPVYIFDRENTGTIVRDMFVRLGCSDESNIFYHGSWNPGGVPEIDEILRKFPGIYYDKPLIVFDSFARFNRGDENSVMDVGMTFKAARELTALGATVVFIHHAGKSGGYRGSSDIKASADFVFNVSSNKKADGCLDTVSLTKYKFRSPSISKLTIRNGSDGLQVVQERQKSGAGGRLAIALKEHPGITSGEFQRMAEKDLGIKRRGVDGWLRANKAHIDSKRDGKFSRLAWVE